MNLRLDTGLLDSHHHFGINSKPQNRFSFRFVDECALLRTDGYTIKHTSAPRFSSQNASMDFLYGKHLWGSGGVNTTHHLLLSPQIIEQVDADYRLEFVTLWTESSSANVTSFDYYQPETLDGSSFIPISELRREDALTALFFLSAKDVMFVKPVDDEWYSAHQPGPSLLTSGEYFQVSAYYADNAANVLGCVGRRQICNPVAAKCSSLNYDTRLDITWNSKEQENAVQFWVNAVATQSPTALDIPQILRLGALKARSNFQQGVQGPLPSDQ